MYGDISIFFSYDKTFLLKDGKKGGKQSKLLHAYFFKVHSSQEQAAQERVKIKMIPLFQPPLS